MKLKTKAIIVGAVGIGVVVVAGTAAAIRAIKRRSRSVLDRKIRTALADIVRMHSKDFVSADGEEKSLFMHYIDKLDNKQLVALCALVQVGYFIKVSGIDPLHASKEEVEKAARKFLVEERLAPITRTELLSSLDSTDTHDALSTAYGVLSNS